MAHILVIDDEAHIREILTARMEALSHTVFTAATLEEGLCIIEQLAQCAPSHASVLIQGESGTGKELFARAVHDNSSVRDAPYVIVDCAAMPDTLIESLLFGHQKGAFTGADKASDGLIKMADAGTLFLDEIGELPLAAQKTFLRVLQEKKFRPVGSTRESTSDFRLITATNRDPENPGAADLILFF